jgi:hypothetical protein
VKELKEEKKKREHSLSENWTNRLGRFFSPKQGWRMDAVEGSFAHHIMHIFSTPDPMNDTQYSTH